jgi:ferric-dicitrate binding protein FerR (iron transport regulator)
MVKLIYFAAEGSASKKFQINSFFMNMDLSNTEQTKRHKLPAFIRIATIGIILFTAFYGARHILSSGFLKGQRSTLYKCGDAVRVINLPDSSRIWMKPGSEVRVPDDFNLKSRKVFLRGEVYFSVKFNPGRPFFVIAGKTTAEVIGTEFIFRAREGSETDQVEVRSGMVAFYPTGHREKSIMVLDGERGIHDLKTDEFWSEIPSLQEETDWRKAGARF